jgi:mobilome CxxCx(11)CxxC protein
LPPNLQAHCRERAFFAFGTSKIFERRVRRLDKARNWIAYLGVVVPLLVGSIALSFGTAWLLYTLVPAGILGTVQLALSAWSLVAKWDDKHAYAVSATQAQMRLFNAWDRLCKRPPADFEEKIAELDAEDQRQEQSDLSQNVLPQEQRFAMRSALYHFGNACVRCGEKPVSMAPSKCDTCGNF